MATASPTVDCMHYYIKPDVAFIRVDAPPSCIENHFHLANISHVVSGLFPKTEDAAAKLLPLMQPTMKHRGDLLEALRQDSGGFLFFSSIFSHSTGGGPPSHFIMLEGLHVLLKALQASHPEETKDYLESITSLRTTPSTLLERASAANTYAADDHALLDALVRPLMTYSEPSANLYVIAAEQHRKRNNISSALGN